MPDGCAGVRKSLRPMLRAFAAVVSAALVFSLAGGSGKAARDLEAVALAEPSVEIVVLEVEGCLYCQIFRRDILPTYRASARAATVPMRFVDINELTATKLRLSAPVDVVPTAIVLQNGRELGRISGYVGPENFFRSIDYLLARSN